MTDPVADPEDKDIAAPSVAQDYYSLLRDMIEKVSNDPGQVRALIYALAWHHFRYEALQSPSVPDAQSRARTIRTLERALELEKAIDLVEAEAAQQSNTDSQLVPVLEQGASEVVAQPIGSTGLPEVVILSERTPARTNQTETIDYAPVSRSLRSPKLLLFFQLAGAAVVGVALFVGIFGWAYLSRQPAIDGASMTRAPSSDSIQSSNKLGQPSTTRPQGQPDLPFPLPKTYGIYASSKGQLTELEPLPVKVPDARVQLSAEIKKPSMAVLPDGDVTFVIFRRDLVNNAPQTASVRIVASVARETRFVDKKAHVVPIVGSWRIRSKAFELKVSPVEGSREMVVIQAPSGFVLPAGRYALVLNGFGYDFTVAGPITAPEQCLEQMQVMNGTVLSECRKS